MLAGSTLQQLAQSFLLRLLRKTRFRERVATAALSLQEK